MKIHTKWMGMGLLVAVGMLVAGCSTGVRSTVETASATNSSQEVMPGTDADRELFLTPGGHYTQADIAANGEVTAATKFEGLKSAHDMFPKAGDRICPVTKTKANPQFTWVIEGQSYEFCCPPCVEEFLADAKSNPQSLEHPDTYIKP